MVQYSLQQFLNDLTGNRRVFEAGASTLTFDQPSMTATFKDPDGNETSYDGSTLNNIVVEYVNETNNTYQKNYIRIEQPSNTVRVQLTDPSEALF